MLNSNEVLNGNFAASRRYGNGHNGIDLKSPNGTPVKSRFAGVVRVTGTNPPGQDFGNYIRVFHPQLGISSWYAHLQSFACHVGQQVGQGQVIGYSNNTGFSTGPHLHYSESKGETTQWINPDLTQGGGEDMVDRDGLYWMYRDILGRPNGNAGDAASEAYLGKPWRQVYNDLYNSKESLAYRTNLVETSRKVALIPGLEQSLAASDARIVQLDARAADNLKAIEALGADNIALNKKVAELEKKLLSCEAQKPSQPNLEDAFRIIIEAIKNLIGGEKK